MLADRSIYPDAPRLPVLDLADISPGVRKLVAALREAGLWTSDSGDGSNYEAGMDCALPFPHVFIVCPSSETSKVTEAAGRVLAENPDVIDWPAKIDVFDMLLDLDGEPAIGAVAVWHADHEAISLREELKS